MNIFATRSFSKLKEDIDPSSIYGINNKNFQIKFDSVPEDALFLIKQTTRYSIADAVKNMDYLDTGTDIDTWRTLSEIYTNETCAAKILQDDWGISVYSAILSCMDDKDFTGVILFNQKINITALQSLGTEKLFSRTDWTVPIIKIDGITFSAQGIDTKNAYVNGLLHGDIQRHLMKDGFFDLKLSDMWTEFTNGEFGLPQFTCSLGIYRIFGFQSSMNQQMRFIGSYVQNDNVGTSFASFQLRQLSETEISILNCPLNRIRFVCAQSQLNISGSVVRIGLNFRGRMQFALLQDGNDFFSYESLSFRNMRIEISTDIGQDGDESNIEFIYREILFSEDEAGIRKGSFLDSIQHGTPLAMSYQDCNAPENMRFTQMNVGCNQQILTRDDSWLGLVIPIHLFHGLSVDILFAFAPNKFYAGYRLKGAIRAGSAVASSLLKLDMKEMQIEKMSDKYAIALRGVKFFVFGKSFPEGSTDLILISDACDTGWYAVYDRK